MWGYTLPEELSLQCWLPHVRWVARAEQNTWPEVHLSLYFYLPLPYTHTHTHTHTFYCFFTPFHLLLVSVLYLVCKAPQTMNPSPLFNQPFLFCAQDTTVPSLQGSNLLIHKNCCLALVGVARCIECLPANQRVISSIPIRAHAWVVSQVPSRGCARGNHTLMFLSLSFSLPAPLSENK